ncbi:MAG: TonB-dependent receptor [Ignavibacteria bacterium]|jgi:hypothetical protein
MKAIRVFIFLVLFFLSFKVVFAGGGSLKGRVEDAATFQPLVGANILLLDTEYGTSTDAEGNYEIKSLPPGMYRVQFSYIGYEKRIITDVFVKVNRSNYLNCNLRSSAIEQDEVVVLSGYFETPDNSPVSAQTLNYEEIRRSPGAREDVSRMIQNFAGVNFTEDDRNDLVIRGGSPTEVQFCVDKIEIPNPNHFGTQGSTGGPINMINAELIQKTNFFTGGFSSEYGNKLSGVLDIEFREGNRSKLAGKVDLNFGGVGGYIEGPFDEGSGSYLIGVHRSFLDLYKGFVEDDAVPIYSNIQGKVVYDFNPNHRISLIWIGGIDKISFEHEIEIDDYKIAEIDTAVYTDVDLVSNQLTIGGSLRSIWTKNFFTDIIILQNYTDYSTNQFAVEVEGFHKPGDDKLQNENSINRQKQYYNNSIERITHAKVEANLLLSKSTTFSFGGYFKNNNFNHRINYMPYPHDKKDEFGNPVKSLFVNNNLRNTLKYGGSVNLKRVLFERLTVNAGMRIDYFDLIKSKSISPRANFKLNISKWLTLTGGYGIYYQNPEFIWVTSDPLNAQNLKDIKCEHVIGGLNIFVTPSTKLTAEVYHKKYSDYAVSADSGYSMITMANAGADFGSNIEARELLSKGTGSAKGFEITIQQKMVNDFYGLLSYSYSDIKQKALDGISRRSAFDNKNVFNFVFGYRYKEWELSIKWRYAGGRPYTPFNIKASIEAGEGRLDLTRINSETYPSYNRFDVRLDCREYYSFGTLVWYVTFENVFNRKNVLTHTWNRAQQKTDYEYQSESVFMGGVSLEF